MKEKILHLEKSRYSNDSLKKLKMKFDVTFLETNSQNELIDFLNADNYFGIFTKLGLEFNQEALDCQPYLKYLITPTTGLNHIDLNYANGKGVSVISLKGEDELLKSIKSTAEHTWAILLMLIRNLDGAFRDVKNGFWRREPFLASELDGKTIGIIGYGRLGKIIAKYADAFGMKVIAYDINSKVFLNEFISNSKINYLLSECDILTLHIPSNKENYNFIDSEKLNKLKKNVVIINTSRGEVIDEVAFLKFLLDNKMASAATDVLHGDSTWAEFSPKDNELIKYANRNKNLIITPHMGGYGKTSINRTRDFIVDKLINKFKLSYINE